MTPLDDAVTGVLGAMLCSTADAVDVSGASTATTATVYSERLRATSAIEYQLGHEYLGGVVHDEATGDFNTFRLCMPLTSYATVVMQGRDEARLKHFMSRGASAESKLRVLEDVLCEHLDRRLFVTAPTTFTAVEPCGVMLLTTFEEKPQRRYRDEHVLAVCDIVSAPVRQRAGFVLRHDALTDYECSAVMQLVVRHVVHNTPTWSQSLLDYEVAGLDERYQLGVHRTALADTLDDLLDLRYLTDMSVDGYTTIFIQRTHFNAHTAYAYDHVYGRNDIVGCWLYHGMRTFAPLMRSIVLARILRLPAITSTRPNYDQFLAVMTTGIPIYLDGGADTTDTTDTANAAAQTTDATHTTDTANDPPAADAADTKDGILDPPAIANTAHAADAAHTAYDEFCHAMTRLASVQ